MSSDSEVLININNYEKIKILGSGTYGRCYLARNLDSQQLCVLKQIEITGMKQQQREEAMKQAKIMWALDHPYIINFFACFLSQRQSYINIIMSYADGGDLAAKIKDARGIPFKEAQVLTWFTQICLAIKHIHDRKIIHRDLKTHNIFLTNDGKIKLGDFGIARSLSLTLEKIKTVVGTPYYMSPEICQNREYSFKTDIWSLGVILFQMLTLKQPFDAGSLPALALKITKGQHAPFPSFVSKDIRKLVTDMLQVKPEKRPSIHKILQHHLIKPKIQLLLQKDVVKSEFSHTTLHNMNIFDKEYFTMGVIKRKQQVQCTKQCSIKVDFYADFSEIQLGKQLKTPQSQKIINSLNNLIIKSGNQGREVGQNAKQKRQQLRRREVSEPNLTPKSFRIEDEQFKAKKIKANNSLAVLEKKKEKLDGQNKYKDPSFKRRSPMSEFQLRGQIQQIKQSRNHLKQMKSHLTKQNMPLFKAKPMLKKKNKENVLIIESHQETLRQLGIELMGRQELSLRFQETCQAKGFPSESIENQGLLTLLYGWKLQIGKMIQK